MKIDVLVKKLSSRLILGLTVLLLLWFVVYVIKESMKYEIFSAFTDSFFTTTTFGALALLLALAILNIGANLNILSDYLLEQVGATVRMDFRRVYAVAIGAVLLITAATAVGLHIINDYNTEKTSRAFVDEMRELKSSYAEIVGKIADKIAQESDPEGIRDLLRMIEANAPRIKNINILFPKMYNGKLVYLQINTWERELRDTRFSLLSDSVFIAPKVDQREFLDAVYNKGVTEDRTFVERPMIAIYSPVTRDGKMVFLFYSKYNESQGRFMKASYD